MSINQSGAKMRSPRCWWKRRNTSDNDNDDDTETKTPGLFGLTLVVYLTLNQWYWTARKNHPKLTYTLCASTQVQPVENGAFSVNRLEQSALLHTASRCLYHGKVQVQRMALYIYMYSATILILWVSTFCPSSKNGPVCRTAQLSARSACLLPSSVDRGFRDPGHS